MTTGDWASVAAAAFAAVAATAAWSTVLLSIRRDRALHKPNVYAAFTTKGRLKPPELVFNNGGPGLAVGLLYLGVIGGKRFLGYVENGFLEAGAEKTEVLSYLTPTPDGEPDFIWVCRDVDENLHVRSNDGRYLREDRRHVLDETTDTRLSRMFERMFPNVDVPW